MKRFGRHEHKTSKEVYINFQGVVCGSPLMAPTLFPGLLDQQALTRYFYSLLLSHIPSSILGFVLCSCGSGREEWLGSKQSTSNPKLKNMETMGVSKGLSVEIEKCLCSLPCILIRKKRKNKWSIRAWKVSPPCLRRLIDLYNVWEWGCFQEFDVFVILQPKHPFNGAFFV